jgi:hypothetical protein
MTGRCHDFPGPAEPVIATSHGWVPLDEPHVDQLAVSGMLLACTPEHVARFQAVLAHEHDASQQRHAAP